MESITLGFAMCGSFCTFNSVLQQLEILCKTYRIIPIMSQTSFECDTRFGTAEHFRRRVSDLCGHEILHTLPQVEPIGPKKLLDAIAVAPATGNTLAKLSLGITDTAVTMAAKSHLRNLRPVLLCVATNDALGASAQNIGRLLNTKNIYFVPLKQDDCIKKPNSLVADFDKLEDCVTLALQGKQHQPIFL